MSTSSRQLRNKKSTGLYLIPFGGIARRLRTIASAIEVARSMGRPLEILWFSTDHFQSTAGRLFTLSPKMMSEDISIREATWKDWFFNDTPRRANLWIPAPFILWRYDRFLSPRKLLELLSHHPDQLTTLLGNPEEKILMSTNQAFLSKRGMYGVIEPTVEVINSRNSRMSGWPQNVVGIHINRKSSVGSVDYSDSPTELFIRRMQNMIEQDSTVSFFLATTSRNEKERLKTIFKDRIFCSYAEVDNESQEGIIESYGELLALSCTRRIISTPNSSFADIAATLTNIPTEQLSIFSSVTK